MLEVRAKRSDVQRALGPLLALSILLWGVGLSVLSFLAQTGSRGGVGFAFRDGVQVVTHVSPGSLAASAGLHAGDRIRARSSADYYRLIYVLFPGQPFTVDVESADGTTRELTLRNLDHVEITSAPGPVAIAQKVIVFIFPCFLGALLVWRRLSVLTAIFAVYVVFGPFSRLDAITAFGWLPNPLFGPVAFALDVMMSAGAPAMLLPFLARFPDPKLRPRRLIVSIDVLCALLIVAAAIVTALDWPDAYRTRAAQTTIIGIIAFFVAIGCVGSFVRARGEQRQRSGWVLLGLIVTAVAYIYNVIDLPYESLLQSTLTGVMLSAFPAAVTYAVLRHRVLDVAFVLNRGLVYATLTAILLLVVTLAHWAAEHAIAESRLATAFEVAVSVIFGLTLHWMHGRVERIIDRVLFRKRQEAQDLIDVRIEALDFATSDDAVDAALVSDAARILRLGSAAVFRVESGGCYVRRTAIGWEDAAERLDANDLLVRSLLAGEGTRFIDSLGLVDENFPAGAARPDLAVPIVLRHRLIAIALYGRCIDGTTLDAIERAMLERLARAAANAYDAAQDARLNTLTADAPPLATRRSRAAGSLA